MLKSISFKKAIGYICIVFGTFYVLATLAGGIIFAINGDIKIWKTFCGICFGGGFISVGLSLKDNKK